MVVIREPLSLQQLVSANHCSYLYSFVFLLVELLTCRYPFIFWLLLFLSAFTHADGRGVVS